ncbi:hypothetical protein GCM10027040_19190 [Halomonas shantousis]
MLERTPPPRPKRPKRGGSRRREDIFLVWDVFIITLVLVNLALLLFDSLFLLPPLNGAFESVAPDLYTAYDTYIHDNFLTIDLAFVAIFLLDVLIGWAVAIAEHRYRRWFFYPFVHWYDVLGCIPLSGFRILRVLRVISLMVRLQRLGVIDITRWSIYETYIKYYHILMEELADHVAIKLLSNVQDEIRSSDALTHRISKEVIRPRKQQLVNEISSRMEAMIDTSYAENRADVHRYVGGLVSRTMTESPEIRRLRRLPLGEPLAESLESSLRDVASRVVHEAIMGLRSPEFSSLLGDMAASGIDVWLHVDERTDRITEHILIEVLEVIKSQIETKRWQENYS